MKLALVLAFALLVVPLAAHPVAANGGCDQSDDPCDPDPSQIDCFQPPKGTITCVLRIVDNILP